MEYETVLKVFFRGKATAKGRHRTARGKDGSSRSYTPEATVEAEASFGYVAQEIFKGKAPLDRNTPLELRMIVVELRPKSKKKDVLFPLKKPDQDNYQKLYSDAMNMIVMEDDCTIVHGDCWKMYGPIPGVYVEVSIVKGAPLTEEDLRELALGG